MYMKTLGADHSGLGFQFENFVLVWILMKLAYCYSTLIIDRT